MTPRTATIATAATAAGLGLFAAGLVAGGALDRDAAPQRARATGAGPQAVSLPERPPEQRSSSPTGVSARTIKGELASRRKDARRRPRKAKSRRRARPRAQAPTHPRPSGGRAHAQSNLVPSPREPAGSRGKVRRPKPKRRERGKHRHRTIVPPTAPAVPAPQAPPVAPTPSAVPPDQDRRGHWKHRDHGLGGWDRRGDSDHGWHWPGSHHRRHHVWW